MAVDSRMAKLKKEVRGVILSSPRGLTITDFLKDYKESIGRTFPFQEFGYTSINDLLKNINDVVRVIPGHGGAPSLVPVTNDKVNHINAMVSRQKSSSNKYSHYNHVPRRTIQEDNDFNSLRKPVQVPVENIANTSHTERGTDNTSNSTYYNNHQESTNYNYNGYTEKSRNEQYAGSFEEQRCFENQRSYQESQTLRHMPNEFQSHHIDAGEYDDHGENILRNRRYEPHSVSDDEIERPPTPGEVIVSEKMKNNFRQLLADHPDGIPSSKFCKLYKEKFGVHLRFLDYGWQSFKEMMVNLPDIFSYVRQRTSQDWMLYDAYKQIQQTEISTWIPCLILEKIAELAKDFPDGLKKTDLLNCYRDKYHADLDVQDMGFDSIDSFLQSCSNVEFVNINGEDLIIPKTSYQSVSVDSESVYGVLPPVSEMNYLWGGHFHENECNPSMAYQPFKVDKKDKLNYAKVYVCDCISPNCIWLQIDDGREDLEKLMYNLNEYYNKYEHNHNLSDQTRVIKDLICTVRFGMDNRWHRAKIISFIESSAEVTVSYVDYGTINVVKSNSIRKLHQQFYSLPVQAIQASLYGLRHKPDELKWSLSCLDFLYNLVFESKFNIDVKEIDESIPKLEVILYDKESKNSLSVNDQLLVASHAVSVGHMPVGVSNGGKGPGMWNEETSGANYSSVLQGILAAADDRRIRTPPGYSSRAVSSVSSPKKISTASSSTCERIRELREDAVALQKEAERLMEEAKQKLLEADVLEQIICKHSHDMSTPNLIESQEYLNSSLPHSDNNFAQQVAGRLNLVESEATHFPLQGSLANTFDQPQQGSSSPIIYRESQQGSPVNSFRQPLDQGPPANAIDQSQGPGLGFSQAHNHPASFSQPQVLGSSYNHVQKPLPQPHQSVQQPLAAPLSHAVHLDQSHFHPIMHNNTVGPPLIMRRGYVEGHSTYTSFPQQNMMYPQHGNVGQWPSAAISPGQWRQQHIPPNMMAFRQPCYPVKPSTSWGSFSRPQAPAGPLQDPRYMNHPIPDSRPLVQSRLEKIDGVPSKLEPNVLPPPSDDEVEVPTHLEPAKLPERKVSTTSTPSPSTSITDLSNLTPKQVKKLEKIEDISLSFPPTNNWSELVPSSLSATNSSSGQNSSKSEFSNQKLIDLMKEEKSKKEIYKEEKPKKEKTKAEKLDDEYRKLDNAITDRLSQEKEAVNHVMKICVQNRVGKSSNMLLLLVGDCVAVPLRQLYTCYWWGDSSKEESSYSEFTSKLKETNLPAYSIFYPDHIPIFDRLREDKIIAEDDLYVHIVNLNDVPLILDIICPREKHDLNQIKEIFKELFKVVLPMDEFWFRKEGIPVFHVELLN